MSEIVVNNPKRAPAWLNPFTRLAAALSILYAVPEVIAIGLSLAKVVIAPWMAAVSLGAGAFLAVMSWLRLKPAAPEPGHDAQPWQKWVLYSLSGIIGLAYLMLWYAAYLSP